MYLTFYGLKDKPFSATPDPRFLYLTPGHREALAHLVYGVQERAGFLVLTGEVGTGKTTLLHALQQRLDGTTAFAFLVNSGLTFDGLLEFMFEEFGIPSVGESRAQRIIAIRRFMMERQRAGENVVIALDEAQNLDLETLEQIRLLSNFESSTDKLVQILIVGQPELAGKLARPELRQLKQRIALRAMIAPLSRPETREYIRRRLKVAGAHDVGLFSERAVERITAYAGGVPRVVNTVCEHCLLIGYAEQKRRVDLDIVERAVAYLEKGVGGHRSAVTRAPRWAWLPRRRWALAALAPLLLLSLAAVTPVRREAVESVSHLVGPLVTTLARTARSLVAP